MCGITGIFAFNEVGRFSMINLANAVDQLSSRGPDFGDSFVDYFVGLGHRRLSVIDTSASGNQPMSDPTGRYTIVFNGEIYNYLSLRETLVKQGMQFRSNTDTEVLLQLYMTEGPTCLEKLNGFFAFAIFDKEKNTLFVARDRIGIKPLLYHFDEDKFLFASEMKALLSFGIEKQLDYISLKQYLQLNYIPAPHTIFKQVKKLLPGHYMLIANGQMTVQPYYQVSSEPAYSTTQKHTYEAQQKQLLDLFEEAVQKRLIADVPLGAFLSGGIDSSAVVAMAAKHMPQLNTFSIGYLDEPFFDETRYANLVAKHCGTNHTVFTLSNQDLYAYLFDMLDYLDEPFADSSALAVYILSKYTQKQVKVALSGDGADELFAGYHKHMGEYRMRTGGGLASLISTFAPLWRTLPKSRNNFLGNKIRQLHRFTSGTQLTARERYWQWASFATEQEAGNLLSSTTQQALEASLYEERKQDLLKHIQGESLEDFNDILYTDLHLVLPNDMLTKVDMMSMANGLEVRVPFLDHRIVDFAFSLPTDAKINRHMRKRILQDSFKSILPKELYNRPKKGFEVPLLKWLRTELRSLLENDLLQDQFIEEQGIFEVKAIQALKQQLFSKNPTDVHARIWGLLVFQHWWKKYF
ncbi:MAG: asparagine synthase (glutamine-hydrolyzing) [Thermonemataceae bacterium]